jgi:hypothetical protein
LAVPRKTVTDALSRLATTRVDKESSGSNVELEQAAESVAKANGPALRRHFWRREEEKNALALVVPFTMMMINVLD